MEASEAVPMEQQQYCDQAEMGEEEEEEVSRKLFSFVVDRDHVVA